LASSNVQKPDIRPICGKPDQTPKQGAKKRTCPGKSGGMVTYILETQSFARSTEQVKRRMWCVVVRRRESGCDRYQTRSVVRGKTAAAKRVWCL